MNFHNNFDHFNFLIDQTENVNVENDEVGGYNWSEGTTFQILLSAIMKRKDYWTDPEKFDPDRFYKIEESNKYLLEKQHAKNSFIMYCRSECRRRN